MGILHKAHQRSLTATGAKKRTRYLAAASLLAISFGISPNALAQTSTYSIGPQPLETALEAYAEQEGLFLVADVDLSGVDTSGVSGELSREDAIGQLLAGSNFQFRFIDDNTLLITAPDRVASVPSKIPRTGSTANGSAPLSLVSDEVVVTGSNIRGRINPTSPVISFSRQDIDLTGVATVQDFIRLIPQNFNSTTSLTLNSDNPFDSTAPSSGGASIDLRGLGPGATLTLLNGRRTALSGAGTFFDASTIPFTVIDRVEILTDGASAIYGSDAIGGVVNFITMRDFEGFELRARYGGVTSGNNEESQVGGIAGTRWDNGGAFISAEYTDVNSLIVSDRDFIDLETAFPDATLFPRQESFSLYGSIDQQIGNRLQFSSDVVFTNRDVESNLFFVTDAQVIRRNTESVFLSSQLAYEISDKISASLYFDYGQSRTQERISRDNFSTVDQELENGNLAIEGQISGDLLTLPGGVISGAVGGGYREENLSIPTSSGFGPERSRGIGSAYGELLIPLIGPDQSIPLAKEITLSIAGRYEHYSDIGDVFNPRVGLAWDVSDDLILRGTYSESFRAPPLFNLFSPEFFAFGAFADNDLDPVDQDPRAPDGSTFFLFSLGAGNQNLQPEEAISWTAGFSYSPEAIKGFNLEGNFFDVSYRDRIDIVGFLEPITNPDFSIFVDRSPNRDDLANLLQRIETENIRFTNIADFTVMPEDVGAFVNAGIQNLSTLDVRGLDFWASYKSGWKDNNFAFSLNTSYLLDYDIQGTDVSESFSALDTVYRPVDLRMRGTASWERNGFTIYAAVNHIGSYINNRSGGPDEPIDSWTTADFTFSYKTGAVNDRSLLNNTLLSLSVQNIFDEDPPFVQTTDGLNYDTANASPLGRFWSVQLTKQW